MTTKVQKEYLKEIAFSELVLWDVKRLFLAEISSRYDIVSLGEVIIERNEKIKVFEHPEKSFGILGVNNKIGLFDSYEERGGNINQPYKRVLDGDLVYNPYRINVGSIGLKTNQQSFNLISSAYVVFLTNQERLLSEFLYILFKTKFFTKTIQENTTGSVRQNLKFSTLSNIRIPLPPLSEQKRIVKEYNSKIAQAEKAEKDIEKLKQSMETYLMKELGIKKNEKIEKKKGLQKVSFMDLNRWNLDYLRLVSLFSNRIKGRYSIRKLRDFMISYQYGISEKSSKENIGVPMLRMNNILDSELITADLKFVSLDNRLKEKYLLNRGDLLFNRTNSKELVGKTAVFNKEKEYVFASYLIRVVLNTDIVDVDYINFVFNSELLQVQKDMMSRQITGQANINSQEMQDFLFPIPPLEIQKKIVKKISSIKEEIKKLRNFAEEKRNSAIQDFEKEIFEN